MEGLPLVQMLTVNRHLLIRYKHCGTVYTGEQIHELLKAFIPDDARAYLQTIAWGLDEYISLVAFTSLAHHHHLQRTYHPLFIKHPNVTNQDVLAFERAAHSYFVDKEFEDFLEEKEVGASVSGANVGIAGQQPPQQEPIAGHSEPETSTPLPPSVPPSTTPPTSPLSFTHPTAPPSAAAATSDLTENLHPIGDK